MTSTERTHEPARQRCRADREGGGTAVIETKLEGVAEHMKIQEIWQGKSEVKVRSRTHTHERSLWQLVNTGFITFEGGVAR